MATILLVDDDPNARVLLNRVLGQELGHDLLFAPDGEAAIEIFERRRPDLVITDLVMPRLNGMRLIEYLTEHFTDVCIVAITGKAPEQLDAARAAGARAALVKPLEREDLIQATEEALSTPRPWD